MDDDANLGGIDGVGIADFIGLDDAVFQFYSFFNETQMFFFQGFVEEDVVYFSDFGRGVSQFFGKVLIVGHQQHTGGVPVEASYRINALLAGFLDQIKYCTSPFGVGSGGDHILGLVDEDVYLGLGVQFFSFKAYFMLALYLLPHFCYNLSVVGYESTCNQLVGFTATANPTVGNVAVQADGFGLGLHGRFLCFAWT